MKSYLISRTLLIEHIKYSKADTPREAQSAENHWSVLDTGGRWDSSGERELYWRITALSEAGPDLPPLRYISCGRSSKGYDDRIQEPTN